MVVQYFLSTRSKLKYQFIIEYVNKNSYRYILGYTYKMWRKQQKNIVKRTFWLCKYFLFPILFWYHDVVINSIHIKVLFI